MNILDFLQLLVTQNASDLHLVVGVPPTIRVHGRLLTVEGTGPLKKEDIDLLLQPILTESQQQHLKDDLEIDLGYQFKDLARFRINVYHQQGTLGAAFRLIPTEIKTIDELQLPPIFHDLTSYRQGLVLMTGPTGEGKSTTLAALIHEINASRAEHILTIEDPVEFVHVPIRSLISQREVGQDTKEWVVALRSALREDPDVVLVGEMRDYETIASTITLAETGHLVFGTIHTNSAAQTIDRIIDVFPSHQQAQVRQQLSMVLQAVVSQRLIPTVRGDRVAATEVMLATSAIRNLIREQKTYQIDNAIQTSGDQRMILFETSLLKWMQQGVITPEVAREYALRPEEFDRIAHGQVGPPPVQQI